MSTPPDAIETFKDKLNRSISVSIENDVIAFDLCKKIGQLSIETIEYESYSENIIFQIEICEAYRRAGIGINLLRIACNHYGQLRVGNWSPYGDNPLHAEGRALMEAGVKEGYVQAEIID